MSARGQGCSSPQPECAALHFEQQLAVLPLYLPPCAFDYDAETTSGWNWTGSRPSRVAQKRTSFWCRVEGPASLTPHVARSLLPRGKQMLEPPRFSSISFRDMSCYCCIVFLRNCLRVCLFPFEAFQLLVDCPSATASINDARRPASSMTMCPLAFPVHLGSATVFLP